jgi:CubicO group peptidase (beta-lactamase class C family)
MLALAACAGAPPTERLDGAAGPRFNPSGPEREAYGGTLTGFARATAANFWQTPYLVDSHSRFDEIFPSRRVAKAASPSPLRRAPAEPRIGYRFADLPRTLDDYLARHPTTGLLIARGDTILVERYQYDRRDTHRFQSWSMAKTVTSMLVGIAIDEGRIKSIDDRAEAYVPELRGTEYGRTPLRHLLTMSSCVRFIEEYTGTDDVSKLARDTFINAGGGGAAAVAQFNTRDVEPGKRYYYASSETQVLGLVLRGAIGRPVAEYLSEKIWRPMGAEADAAWSIDRSGQESTFCCLSAVLRDYARFALLLAHEGRAGDRQIIPRAWVAAATTASAPYLQPQVATRYFGYGYQTWIFPERRGFGLLGVRGQAIFVDPAAKLVMVHTAVRKSARDPGGAEAIALFNGLPR